MIDEGTTELMTKFFEKMLQGGLSKEEALRQAKLEMLQGKFSNPYYWSAFGMYGE
ncbi:MAG: CHAT domain-containing protein [Bacteroidota bacterium]